MSDMKIEIEHIFIFIIVAFMLYHFIGRGCGCNNGFSVGGVKCDHTCTGCESQVFCEAVGRPDPGLTAAERAGGYSGGCRWHHRWLWPSSCEGEGELLMGIPAERAGAVWPSGSQGLVAGGAGALTELEIDIEKTHQAMALAEEEAARLLREKERIEKEEKDKKAREKRDEEREREREAAYEMDRES